MFILQIPFITTDLLGYGGSVTLMLSLIRFTNHENNLL